MSPGRASPTPSLSVGFEELIESIYEGPLEEIPWHGFLECLRETLAATAVTLILRPPTAGDEGLLLTEGGTGNWESAYKERYFVQDPFVDLPLDEVVTLAEVVSMEAFVKSEFYEQFMRPSGAFHVIGFDTREPAGLEARIRASRGPEAAEFGDREREALVRMLPHLRRALQIHTRISRTESERDLYAQAMDQLAVGTIIVDERCKVVQLNRVAQQLIERCDGLLVVDGALRAGSREETLELQQRIDAALESRQKGKPGVVEALRVCRRSDGPPLGIVVRPVPMSERSERRGGPAAAIFVSVSGDGALASLDIVGKLFGFTQAEASLATLLANGLSLDTAANELGIARNTARAQLRSIFAKTGVTRQAELVRLVLRSVAALG